MEIISPAWHKTSSTACQHLADFLNRKPIAGLKWSLQKSITKSIFRQYGKTTERPFGHQTQCQVSELLFQRAHEPGIVARCLPPVVELRPPKQHHTNCANLQCDGQSQMRPCHTHPIALYLPRPFWLTDLLQMSMQPPNRLPYLFLPNQEELILFIPTILRRYHFPDIYSRICTDTYLKKKE